MKLIDLLGLKNFRIFDDQTGFFEELSSINILTGANNSGKSSVIKALQMLKNSVSKNEYPFDLDLTDQEHLLGDFENVLYNKKNKNIEVTLPFLFFGITSIYITLSFAIPEGQNPYEAKLRSIKVYDKIDNGVLFSFKYRIATKREIADHRAVYDKNLAEYKKRDGELSEDPNDIFLTERILNQPPSDDNLEAYIEWQINLKKLKDYLANLSRFYKIYLDNGQRWDEEQLETIDENARKQKLFFIPTSVIKLFGKDLDINKWNDFLKSKTFRKKLIRSKAKVVDRDFEPDDFFQPIPQIEHILYYRTSEILRHYLKWQDDFDPSINSVIEHCFKSSWDLLMHRLSSIIYISNIKEENARSYNAAYNSPFINLLKRYQSNKINTKFIEKYLQEFQIGKEIKIEYEPKYQSIFVSIITLDGTRRELVDFGYGIKQLVLILIQISILAKQNYRIGHRYGYDGEEEYEYYDPSLLIIEEPESTLHPKWQSLLAEMIAEASKKYNIQLIIESHSEYLIRKFQTLVAEKKVESQDIKIFYLRSAEKAAATGRKQVESLVIQDDGAIDFNVFDGGFFDESYNLSMSLLNVKREKFLTDFEALKLSSKANDEKLIDLQERVDEYLAKADLRQYETFIAQNFTASKLSTLTVKYLISGQYLLSNIHNNSDYSPVILQYGRAIENELIGLFTSVSSSGRWSLGDMQANLETFKSGVTVIQRFRIANVQTFRRELNRRFTTPTNLKIELLHDLRDKRNLSGHPGHVKTRQDAIAYITKANEFLNSWIAEKK
jgi:AAA15 family ATPase/GTPase